MTNITSTARTKSYTGNGTSGPFDFSFQVNSFTEVKVFVDDTLKTAGAHYNVENSNSESSKINADGTGRIRFTSGNFPTSGQRITIVSDVPLSRTSVYTTGGPITASSLETDFDTSLMHHQQISTKINRTITAPESDVDTISMTLPSAPFRANSFVKFDANGNVTTSLISDLTTTTFTSTATPSTTASPSIILKRDVLPSNSSVSPFLNTVIGELKWQARNDANELLDWARIVSTLRDEDDGEESVTLSFEGVKFGSFETMLSMNNISTTYGTDFRFGGRRLFFESPSGNGTLTVIFPDVSNTDRTLIFPDVTSTIATRTGAETLTSKTLTNPRIAHIDSLGSGDITLDAGGDIKLDADNGNIFFQDNTTTFGSVTNSSGNLIIKSGTTTALTFDSANVTAGGNFTVTGDLTVNGNTVTVNTATLSVEDPLIILAKSNNSSDSVDIGFYGLYDTSGSQDLYAGLFRDANDSGKWKLFKDLQSEPTTTVDTSGTGYTVGTLVANVEGNVTGDVTGNVSGTAGIATSITASANNSTDETVFPTFVDGATGTQGLETDTGLTYNPSTGVLTATQFTGTLAGNATSATTATTATNANHVSVADNENTDENNLIPFIEDGSATGNVGLESDGDLTYNPSTGRLSATQLAGTLQTASQTNVTGVGVITTGVWNATPIADAYISSSATWNAKVDTGGTGLTKVGTTLNVDTAQPGITSLGTLTSLTVDSITINGNEINVSSGDLVFNGGIISLKNSGSQSELRLYCESNNAHYASLKAPAHADFSGNITLTLPATTGTLLSTANSDAPTTTTSSGDADFVLVDDGGVMKKITPANLGIGGGSGITVQDEGSSLSTAGTTLNFVGAGVTASGTGATKTITIAGGSDGVTVQDEGSALSTTGTTLNFVGAGVTASGTGSTKTITISGGSGSGGAFTDQTWGASLNSDTTNKSKLLLVNDVRNVIIGANNSVAEPASSGNTGGSFFDNIFIGHDAGATSTTGYSNIMIGTDAGNSLTTGDQNVFIGTDAGKSVNADHDGSVFIGKGAGFSCPDAGDERLVAVGFQAGMRTRDGTVCVGNQAGTNYGYYGSGAGPVESVHVGTLSGYNYYNYYTYYNTTVGAFSGQTSRQGDHNVMLGIRADGLSSTTGSAVVIGSNAKVASSSVSIGYQSQNSGNSSSYNMVSVGYQAGYDMDGGDHAVFVGFRAGYSGGTNDYNVGIGSEALYALTSGGQNVGIGYYALRNNLSGSNNIGIGSQAGDILQTGSLNTIVGMYSDGLSSDTEWTTIVGAQANAGSYSVVMGRRALYSANGSNQYMVAIGNEAGYDMDGGDYSIYVGYRAGYGGGTGDYNIGVGSTALYNIDSGVGNVAMGQEALNDVTSGDYNIAIGYQAGDSVTTGDYGIFIGNGSDAVTDGLTNPIAIGLNAKAGQSCISIGANPQLLASTSNVPVGTITIGSSAGFSLNGADDCTIIGQHASDGNAFSGSNNTCIGHDADPSSLTASNEITLGDSNIATLRCQVTSITALSDERDKTAIEDLDLGLKFVNAMKPRKFTWNRRDGKWEGKKEIGFIAQELHEVEMDFSSTSRTRLVSYENPSRLEAQPMNTYPILVKAIQELSAKVDSLQAEITKLKGA